MAAPRYLNLVSGVPKQVAASETTAAEVIVATGATGLLDASFLPTVDVAHGGTGQTTLTAHSVLVGNGTSAVTPLTVGATGEFLIAGVAADPAFGRVIAYVPAAFPAGATNTWQWSSGGAPPDPGGTTNTTAFRLINTIGGTDAFASCLSTFASAIHGGTGLGTTCTGFLSDVRSNGGGTVTTANALQTNVRSQNASSVITTGVHLSIPAPTVSAGGAIGTLYGLKMASQIAAGVTTPWQLALDGASDKSYIAGSISIGQTSAPAVALDVNGAIGPKGYTIATLPSASAKAGAVVYCSDLGGGGGMLYSNGTTWQQTGINNYETQSTATGSKTINPLTNAPYQNFTATLTGNVTLTLGTTNAYKGATFLIRNKGVGAFTFAIVNGGGGAGTLKTFASATATDALCVYDGTDWVLMQDSTI